jgi:hypothetical protein
VTFPFLVISFSAFGGIFTNAQNVQAPESVGTANGVPLQTGRRIKATVNVINGPLVSQVTLEAT